MPGDSTRFRFPLNGGQRLGFFENDVLGPTKDRAMTTLPESPAKGQGVGAATGNDLAHRRAGESVKTVAAMNVRCLLLVVAVPPLLAARPAEAGEPDHWALRPVSRPSVPSVDTRGWARNPIDAFIWRRLNEAGLTPSPQADATTLARRAHFDVLGLPPTPDRVLQTDRLSEPYERLVQRLLSNPHHGERWARHWLDVARYADTKGYVFFESRDFPWAWTYRDYVVRSLNADLPYDQFVLDQLAADQLDLDGRPNAQAAMGFLTLSPRFMNNTHDQIDDQIDVVTRGLMGLTVTCARCHDHKYDPIPQADYYSLYGVFRSSSEPLVPPVVASGVATSQDDQSQKAYRSELTKRSEALHAFIVKAHTDMLVSSRRRVGEYLLQAQRTLAQPPTDDFMLLVEAGGLNPTVVLRWRVHLEKLEQAAVVEGAVDRVWHPWQQLAALELADSTPFADAARDVIQKWVAAQGEDRTDTPSPLNSLLINALKTTPPRSLEDVSRLYSKVLNDVETAWQASLDEATKASQPPPLKFADNDREELRQVFHAPGAPANIPRVFGWGALALLPDRPAQGVYKKLRKALEDWLISGKGAPARAMTLEDNPEMYAPRIFQRGNPNRPAESVPRQLPGAIRRGPPRPFVTGSGRLELARAIASRDNPLTARVIVNRIWLHHFGQGLVATPSDFGTRGGPPTHPRLLDYLADWFTSDANWSLKRLHRLILTSATYRQTSDHRAAAHAVDPRNHLLWRMNRRRLGFEAMRDAQLSYADILDETLGGKPRPAMFTGKTLDARRSIYGRIDRMNPAALLRTFDVPSPQASCGRRDETTVAPQALHLMNHQSLQILAGRLASRTSGSSSSRTSQLFQLLFHRQPDASEARAVSDFVASFGDESGKGWTAVAHALLMSNESQFID